MRTPVTLLTSGAGNGGGHGTPVAARKQRDPGARGEHTSDPGGGHQRRLLHYRAVVVDHRRNRADQAGTLAYSRDPTTGSRGSARCARPSVGVAVTSPRDRMWTQPSQHRCWAMLRKLADRPGLDFYELRHGAATMLVERGTYPVGRCAAAWPHGWRAACHGALRASCRGQRTRACPCGMGSRRHADFCGSFGGQFGSRHRDCTSK